MMMTLKLLLLSLLSLLTLEIALVLTTRRPIGEVGNEVSLLGCEFATEWVTVVNGTELDEPFGGNVAEEAKKTIFMMLIKYAAWNTWNPLWLSAACVRSDARKGPVNCGGVVEDGDEMTVDVRLFNFLGKERTLLSRFRVDAVDGSKFCWHLVTLPEAVFPQLVQDAVLRTGRCTEVRHFPEDRSIKMRTTDPHDGILAPPICLLFREMVESNYRSIATTLGQRYLDLQTFKKRFLPGKN